VKDSICFFFYIWWCMYRIFSVYTDIFAYILIHLLPSYTLTNEPAALCPTHRKPLQEETRMFCSTTCRTVAPSHYLWQKKHLFKISHTSVRACVCVCVCVCVRVLFNHPNTLTQPSNHILKVCERGLCHWWNRLSVTRFKFHTDLESAWAALSKAGFYGNETTEWGNFIKTG